MLSRRSAILGAALAGVARPQSIDREVLIRRHNPVLRKPDPLTPLSVGNGEFAFTADVTGLQTFPEFHAKAMPLATQSQWGWHSAPNPEGFRLDDVMVCYDAQGRKVCYPEQAGPRSTDRARRATEWLRANPHRLDLGRIGLILPEAVGINGLTQCEQTLDLWRGTLGSRFTVAGRPVRVITVCHPERDLIAVRVEGRLGIRIEFPYPAADWAATSDWNQPGRHTTRAEIGAGGATLERRIDDTVYYVAVRGAAGTQITGAGPHRFDCRGGETLELAIEFSDRPIKAALPDFAATRRAAETHWRRFWQSGGAIELAASKDPRAREIERRMVLSQYLTAIQCAGSAPPQETGLTTNSWYGKSHLEMHWWHAAHFALWGRTALLEKSLGWYEKIRPRARETAARQGYRGVRWPKMVGPDGRESPSSVGVFLVWQQPHPIFYAELVRRARPARQTVERYERLVLDTAEFMAGYARDEASGRCALGPPLIPAQESYGSMRARVVNPTFELAYWWWGLETAQQWRRRLGMKREPIWDDVLRDLPKPAIRDGAYAAIAVEPYTIRTDHPSMLGALGMLPPTPLIDPAVMERTLDSVFANWDWPSTWGWDYPLIAMTAARLGRPGKAIDALLMDAPKNRYLANGHNYQRPNLPLYLPGNGGLLYALAMMAAGWDGAPSRYAPGFPDDGNWTVRWEGLAAAP